MKKIYLAGPLFGIADQHRNLILGKELCHLDYEVILPQVESGKFIKDGKIDLRAIINDCAKHAMTCDILVANLDGTDADSGTAVEVGIAYGVNWQNDDTSLIIGVRTDFRTDIENEIGINGMFHLCDKIIYKPAYEIKDITTVLTFYRDLAKEIDSVVQGLR